MGRALTGGQWAIFIALTCFTIVGGLVYLIAEGHFNRVDRDFAASPHGAAYIAKQTEAQTALAVAKAQAAALAPRKSVGFAVWVALAFAAGIVLVRVFA